MNSDVHCKVNSATFSVPLLSLGLGNLKRLRRAGDRALKTTVEQTLMRGLNTAFPCVRLGLPRSASGRRFSSYRPHNSYEDSPPKLCLRHYAVADCCQIATSKLTTSFSQAPRVALLLAHRLNFSAYCPQEGRHFTGDRCRDQCLTLSARDQPPVTCAKTKLCFPGNVAHRLCHALLANL
jgi:hypothetical protein